MLEQLLQIQSSCLSEGALKTAQLVNELMAQAMASQVASSPVDMVIKLPPAKPKQPERQYTRTQRSNEAVIHCPTINRLFHEMRRRLDISGHKLANSIGYASQSNIAGMRTRDKSKEFVATADAARLVKIFGPEILIKEQPSLGES
jgi:hypothetical protein